MSFLPVLDTPYALNALFESQLTDFLLAFALFTALGYAVFGRRLGNHRAAAMVAGTLGLALAVGLVWWEIDSGISIRHLGPIAAGFGLLILAVAIYESFKLLGGRWAGASAALGICLVAGWALSLPWLGSWVLVWGGLLLAVAGVVWFLRGKPVDGAAMARNAAMPKGDDPWRELRALPDVAEDAVVDANMAQRISRKLEGLRAVAPELGRRPDLAVQAREQLKTLLPAEGWLTQRLAQLREKAEAIRRGNLAGVQLFQDQLKSLPEETRGKAAQELMRRYQRMQLQTRMARLDAVVAATEKQVRDLTRGAYAALEAKDYQRVTRQLQLASELQKRVTNLVRVMARNEARLVDEVKAAVASVRVTGK